MERAVGIAQDGGAGVAVAAAQGLLDLPTAEPRAPRAAPPAPVVGRSSRRAVARASPGGASGGGVGVGAGASAAAGEDVDGVAPGVVDGDGHAEPGKERSTLAGTTTAWAPQAISSLDRRAHSSRPGGTSVRTRSPPRASCSTTSRASAGAESWRAVMRIVGTLAGTVPGHASSRGV
ncbi:MAG: hypothetical protein HS111_05815 [Kofleriaceae bacterium]|nr:hypothetical protein [Kofleriaceae bacterium]